MTQKHHSFWGRKVQIMWPSKAAAQHLLLSNHPNPLLNDFVQGTLLRLCKIVQLGEATEQLPAQKALTKLNSYLYHAMLDESSLVESELEDVATQVATSISEPLLSVRSELQTIAAALAEIPILEETNRYGVCWPHYLRVANPSPPPRRSWW